MSLGGTSTSVVAGSEDEAEVPQSGGSAIKWLTEEQEARRRDVEHALCERFCSIVRSELQKADAYAALPAVDFSEDAKPLLLEAWRLAEGLKDRRVRAEHLLVALLNSDNWVQLLTKTDREASLSLVTGTFVRLANFGGGRQLRASGPCPTPKHRSTLSPQPSPRPT